MSLFSEKEILYENRHDCLGLILETDKRHYPCVVTAGLGRNEDTTSPTIRNIFLLLL